MSRNAIQQVVQELNLLPESDQQLVLNFLRTLQRNHDAAPTVPVPRRGHNPALKSINNSLVFTGEIGDPNVDWLQVVREERDGDITRKALDHVRS